MDKQTILAKVWTWDCPVEGCMNLTHKRRSGGVRPIKYQTAKRSGRYHMDKYHPELDRDSVIIRKVK